MRCQAPLILLAPADFARCLSSDLLYTCAQEICQQRQGGHSFVNHNSLIDLAHAKMVLLKASEYSLALGLTDAASVKRRARWDTVGDNLADLPLTYHPGTNWEYSIATDVLARLVEVLSGERFDAYIKTHIFQPLGMVDTAFCVRPADSASRRGSALRVRGAGARGAAREGRRGERAISVRQQRGETV